MTAIGTLPVLFATGNHASRPAASAVGKGGLYSCTTHSLVYQTDGSSWTTWATLGGSLPQGLDTTDSPQFAGVNLGHASDTTLTRVSAGVVAIEGTNIVKAGAATGSGLTMATARLLGRSTASTGAIEEISVGSGLTLSGGSLSASGSGGSVPGWMSWFAGTTSSTEFYWDGDDVSSFTEQTVSGSATWAEGGNLALASVSNQTADDASAILIAKTINTGDAWMVAVNTQAPGSDSGGSTSSIRGMGIVMTDGTSTTSNCVIGHIQLDYTVSTGPLLVGRHGTLTNYQGGAPWVSQVQYAVMGGWLFLKLTYVSANTFRLEVGPSPYQLSAFGESDISKTMTPTHIGITAFHNNAGRTLAAFGPLKKV